MRVETRIKTIESDIYIANDGIEFKSERDCLYHEWELRATKVYMVSKRGQRSDTNEVYSTERLAREAIGHDDVFTMTEVQLDRRFWERSKCT